MPGRILRRRWGNALNTLTPTTVSAEVRGLDVGLKGNVRMLIKRVCGGFTAQKGGAAGDMAIRLTKETGFDGNSVTFVDGKGKRYILTVGIERDVFSGHDTFSAITAAAGCRTAPPDEGAMQGTVVKPLKWKGPEFPGSTIDPERRNTVSVPGFGRVSFGEITLAPRITAAHHGPDRARIAHRRRFRVRRRHGQRQRLDLNPVFFVE